MGQKIADALRVSPVYVDPAYAEAVPDARRLRLVAQIRTTHLPIKVALVPLAKGDAFDGDPGVLAQVLHDRIGGKSDDLVLITVGDGDWLGGKEWPDGKYQAQHAVDAVALLGDTRNAGLADRVAKAVELVAGGDGDTVYAQATADLSRDDDPGIPWAPVTLTAALLAGCALYYARRHRFPQHSQHGQLFSLAPTDDTGTRIGELRRRAEAEVDALGRRAHAANPPAPRALDAYEAARIVLHGARGAADLAGALALAAAGRDALAPRPRSGPPEPGHPLCHFNPLHGRAPHRTTRDGSRIAVCTACHAAVRARRAPDILADEGPDGRTVPYFDVPADHSVWAATGYGSPLTTGDDNEGYGDGDLVRRVRRALGLVTG
ncbi:hypothetical protein ACIQNU_29780 [Streptomyces sp. NPDC091292]|uniref:hypothetical protein n=1 Tax=Streptomyces sp. NPDC091292 TaxID=3365991 RepID=UPI0038089FFF